MSDALVGVSVMPLDNRRDVLVDVATTAERLGYDGYFLPETWAHDVTVLMAEAAVKTRRIVLGTGILGVWGRSAGTLAMGASTLAAISGGRFTVTLDTTSTPPITALTGTVFALGRLDTIPPTCSASASPDTLWPANNKFVRVTLKVKVGRHLFMVRAIDAAGLMDPTPARDHWTRKAKRKPKGNRGNRAARRDHACDEIIEVGHYFHYVFVKGIGCDKATRWSNALIDSDGEDEPPGYRCRVSAYKPNGKPKWKGGGACESRKHPNRMHFQYYTPE